MFGIKATNGDFVRYCNGFCNTFGTARWTKYPVAMFSTTNEAESWAKRYLPGYKYEIVRVK